MSLGVKTQRREFEKVVKRYQKYLQLYALLNNGSYEGAKNFPDFYKCQVFTTRYSDPRVLTLGYGMRA